MIQRRAVRRHERPEQSVGPPISGQKVSEPVGDLQNSVLFPAQAARLREREYLPRLDTPPSRRIQRIAIQAERLVKAAQHQIGTASRPDGIGRVRQPSDQLIARLRSRDAKLHAVYQFSTPSAAAPPVTIRARAAADANMQISA